jgi:hypothetical protein
MSTVLRRAGDRSGNGRTTTWTGARRWARETCRRQPTPGEDGGEHVDVKRPIGRRRRKRGRRRVEESDAALARKLSTEINSRSRRGASLTASASSPRKAKRKPKKSPETVESEEEDEDGAKSSRRSGVRPRVGSRKSTRSGDATYRCAPDVLRLTDLLSAVLRCPR